MAGRLQTELKKRQPFSSVEQEAALNILKTGDMLQNRLGRLFRDTGLTTSQYNVLRILVGEGAPLPSLEIASRLIQAVPAITGLIDRLEERELVVRKRCSEDRRVVYVAVTEAGRDLVAQIAEPLSQLHRDLLSHLSREDLESLINLLERARAPWG